MGLSKWMKAWKLRKSVKNKIRKCREELETGKCDGRFCWGCNWELTKEEKESFESKFER